MVLYVIMNTGILPKLSMDNFLVNRSSEYTEIAVETDKGLHLLSPFDKIIHALRPDTPVYSPDTGVVWTIQDLKDKQSKRVYPASFKELFPDV